MQRGRLVIVPMGGDLQGWAERLAPLGCQQLHLYDRESEPETSQRRALAKGVNARPNCQAVVTSKRSLENYLHADAIAAAGGGILHFEDDDCVASLLARAWFERVPQRNPWTELSRRAHRRMLNRIKHWLNTKAVEQMTPELLAKRDPAAELTGWLAQITSLAT